MKRRIFPLAALFLALCFLPLVGQTEGAVVYVTNTGKKYHRENCGSLSRSRIALSLGDALRSGYEACALCKPPVLPGPGDAGPETSGPGGRGPEESPPALYRLNSPEFRSVEGVDLSRMVRAEAIGHIDGDTLRVRIPNPPAGLKAVEIVRMIGVDTPETVHPRREVEYFGREAGEFTRRRLLDKPLLLAFDWDLRDRYGRLLAYIYTPEGACHNAALIREGYAHAYTRYSFQFMDEFRGLEQEAREDRRGLWQ